MMPRIYQHTELKAEMSLELDQRAHHYLLHVLRMKAEDELAIFNDQQMEFAGIIQTINRKKIIVLLTHPIKKQTESPFALHLAQGLAKGEKMDFIIQKAVELGVHTITPLYTEFSVPSFSVERAEKRLAHWQQIAISACEQCGRNVLPIINPLTNIKTWLEIPIEHPKIILSPYQINKSLDFPTSITNMTVLIGPEGGLSSQEEVLAINNGFLPLRLGSRILRTETAAIAAMAILQHRFGDF